MVYMVPECSLWIPPALGVSEVCGEQTHLGNHDFSKRCVHTPHVYFILHGLLFGHVIYFLYDPLGVSRV